MVFRSAQYWVRVSDGYACMVGGSVFHMAEPETAKLLWPDLVLVECGTARSSCLAEEQPKLMMMMMMVVVVVVVVVNVLPVTGRLIAMATKFSLKPETM